MANDNIAYKDGYKYQLVESYEVTVAIKPPQDVTTDYISLNNGGRLVLKKGYAWDGPSGPTFDTPNFMRGSLVHDALYQLMRMNLLSDELHRKTADQELKRMCREDGMSSIRAWWVYESVRHFGGSAASAHNAKQVLYAPRDQRRQNDMESDSIASDTSCTRRTSHRERVRGETEDVYDSDAYVDLTE